MNYYGINDYRNYLAHHGVKGMKWGHRKDKRISYSTYSKNGDRIDMVKPKPSLLAKSIRKISPRVAKEQDKFTAYDAYVNGKKIGTLQLYKESKTSMNVVWMSVDSRHRGKGYAQAMLKSSSSRAKAEGFKQMTLEVPGNSPDARHIYEKQGFVATKKLTQNDDVWGGLTKMKKKL